MEFNSYLILEISFTRLLLQLVLVLVLFRQPCTVMFLSTFDCIFLFFNPGWN